jgi:hypothetical protein
VRLKILTCYEAVSVAFPHRPVSVTARGTIAVNNASRRAQNAGS